MLVYRNTGLYGAPLAPVVNYPTVKPNYPDFATRWPSGSTSGEAALKNLDQAITDVKPAVVVDPSIPDPDFADENTVTPAKKIVGVAPIGLMALGAGLVAAWAIFRS